MPGFTVQTVPNGHNSGRLFVFSTDTPHECVEAMAKIKDALEAMELALELTLQRQLIHSYAQAVARHPVTKFLVGGNGSRGVVVFDV